MAGRIRAEDVVTVKERTPIEDVVREHVTLRPAGVGALKGLCPFHDEKTPSFNVRPAVGSYHCFGCGAGGDVIRFVQEVEHLTFAEAVERLATRLGMELRYEDGAGPARDAGGLARRGRLLEANRVAEEYYRGHLLTGPEPRTGRDFLRARGFGGSEAERFGVGYAPRGGENLTRHLREKGFTEEEIVTAGLAARGSRGLYDRFRGRLVWPIRDTSGATLGFGARRLFDDDRITAKYLNTAETPVYKKSQVLYGVDLARRAISRDRLAVVVEGYTDVMAAHLSGVEGAVASCGTAFGAEHIKILRRLMRDETGLGPAKVVFTFDGDTAGQNAAMKAFEEDQRWAAQSFVAVAPDGMDPCELRQARGGHALAALVADAVPMFEFAVRTVISRFDLDTAEGRIQAARAAAPIIATIRDASLRPEYVRTVSGWLGLEIEQVRAEVAAAARRPRPSTGPPPGYAVSVGEELSPPYRASDRRAPDRRAPDLPASDLPASDLPTPDLRDPVVLAERQLLQALLQYPDQFAVATIEGIPPEAFSAPAHRAVFDGIRSVPQGAQGRSTLAWTSAVAQEASILVRGLVAELAVAPLPTRADPVTGTPPQRYVDALVLGVHEAAVSRRIADAIGTLRRLQNDPEVSREAIRAHTEVLHELERRRIQLREGLGA